MNADNQLFRGKISACILLLFVLREFKGKIIYVRLNVANNNVTVVSLHNIYHHGRYFHGPSKTFALKSPKALSHLSQ